MNRLQELVANLGDALPGAVVDADSRTGLGVTGVELELPVEWRIEAGGELAGSLPRGRLATGFDPALGRLRLRFSRGGP